MSFKSLILKVFFLVTAMVMPTWALADLAAEDLPPNTQWYAHADFAAMQSSPTGRQILEFLEDEVFSELEEETGIALREDLTAATIFGGAGAQDGAVVLYGEISEKNRTKMQALMELYGDYEKDSRKGVEIYSLDRRERDGDSDDSDSDSDEVFSENRTTFVAFSKRDQLLLTQSRARLDSFVSAGGRFNGVGNDREPGSLLVLKADKSMVNAGMNAGAGIADDNDWNSNILQHMEQIALVLSDQAGKAMVQARLVTSNQQLAESIKNIVQGVISIKALDQNEEPEVLALLRSVKLDLDGPTINASLLIEPDMLREIID